MIEQHRTMELPGQGIVRDPGPNKKHEEYPKMMTHPAYRRGKPDVEIKEMNEHGQPTGRLFYRGGESIRFPPVLVRTQADEEFHASQGYENPVKCDPAAFARLVADVEPVPENYAPIEYPKYVFGKIVNNVAEEEERLIALNVNKDGTPREASSEPPAAAPTLNAEANTLEVWPETIEEEDIAVLEAKLAALKAKKAREEMSTKQYPVATYSEVEASLDKMDADDGYESTAPTGILPDDAAKEAARLARNAKIKATMARKKAEKEAAKAGEAA